MAPFDNVLQIVVNTTIDSLNYLIAKLNALPHINLSIGGFFGVFGYFVGARLRVFNHPDRPYLSPAIRGMSVPLLWMPGMLINYLAFTFSCLTVMLTLLLSMVVSTVNESVYPTVLHNYTLQVWLSLRTPVMTFLVSAVLAGLVSAATCLYVLPRFERGKGLRDIKNIEKLFRSLRSYDPLKYLNLEKGIFVGLEDGKDPVYVPRQKFKETHTQVIGASGSGKGIALGLLGYQFSLAGECVIVIDPKGDQRLPCVLASAAKEQGVEFHHLDLNPNSPPQINLLAGACASEIEEILVGGLGLQPSGTDSDFYRGIDQDAAEALAHKCGSMAHLSLVKLLEFAQNNDEFKKADNLIRRLRQVCQLPVTQTTFDIDLTGIIQRGDVLYIRGSTDNYRVKTFQSMLLIRILQIIKSTQVENKRPVALILDEFKHVLSTVSLDALGTVREYGCHALLAHQSMGDLGACAGLRREEVEPRVVDNTTLKLVYRLNDAKTASDFALRSGKQRTHAESVRPLNDEKREQRSWTEVQECKISEDVFTHLHRPSDGPDVVAAGVLFGHKDARLVGVSPIQTDQAIPPVKAAPAETIARSKRREDLI